MVIVAGKYVNDFMAGKPKNFGDRIHIIFHGVLELSNLSIVNLLVCVYFMFQERDNLILWYYAYDRCFKPLFYY